MKEYIKKNKYVLLTIIILCGIMFYFINQKQGFHEDEIFSYGSSNYKYDNVYRSFGYAEARQDILYNQVLKGNLFEQANNLYNFLLNPNKFTKDAELAKEIPIFRPKESALEYLAIQKEDIFNYASVYINQANDVHPPLFYFLVHFISTIFYNQFSKYIIFTLNLIFFIGTLIIIKKILEKLKHKELTIPTMILYGASMGAISTVMFQRMYMMVTFFSTLYLYFIIKFIKDDYKIKNKILFILTILFGFLTQYYFCIYIVLIYLLISIYLLYKKEFKKLFNFTKLHVISALIGIIFYPFSIEDIFFSYRGLGGSDNKTNTFLENMSYYFEQINKLFSLQNFLLIFIILLALIIGYKIVKKELPKVSNLDKKIMLLFILPIILFITVVSKIAPFLGENYTSRYIMLLFPAIAISIFYLLSFIFKNKKVLFSITFIVSILLTINGLINSTPTYLYKDYSKVMDLANNYQDDYFVYIYDNYFTHLNSMPEFATYKESLILNKNIHDFNLLDNEKLNNSNEFILCIKNWLNKGEILNEVLKNSGYTKYEILLKLNSDVESTYYKITK